MKNLLIIDNSQYYINELEHSLKKHNVQVRGVLADEFIDKIKHPSEAAEFDLVLVDYDLGDVTCIDLKIGEYLREELAYRGPIVLISLHEDFGPDATSISDHYNGTILRERKQYWNKIKKYLH